MAAKSIEAALQEVLDREEIRTLPVRYCHTVWQKDLDGYVNLFTEDGSISTNDASLPNTQGREALRKMIGTGLDAMKPRPFIHNHVVELLGPDRAKGNGVGAGERLAIEPHRKSELKRRGEKLEHPYR